jgi:uncharacterized Zn-finger protein
MTKPTTAAAADSARLVEVGAGDLPLVCPRPAAPLWARHPRVTLDVTSSGEAMCPYCSTHYVFTGEAPKQH